MKSGTAWEKLAAFSEEGAEKGAPFVPELPEGPESVSWNHRSHHVWNWKVDGAAQATEN